MLDPRQLQHYIVKPTLERIGLWSLAAEQLVMGTAAQESALTYVHQLGGGPALGLWQMEPATHKDIWDNYLRYRPGLTDRLTPLARNMQADELVGNLPFACAMCRVHYRRVPEALPPAGDVERMAVYWKEHYNTHLGAGTVDEFRAAWFDRIAPIYTTGAT